MIDWRALTDRPLDRHAVAWAVSVLMGCSAGLMGCSEDAPEAPVTSTTIKPTRPDPATTAPVGERRYVAVLAPLEAIDVTARESGDLVEVAVRPGDTVSQGDTLATLSLAPVGEALTIARAELQSARALLAQHQVDIEAAQRALEIQRDMLARGVGVQKHVDEATFALQRARKVKDGTSALLSERDAVIKQLRRRLQEAVLVAPFNGAVALRYRDPGTAVTAGTPIVRLIRVDALWARFAVPPTEVMALEVNDVVTIEVPSVPGDLSATIRHISPELDPAAQLVFVDAMLTVPKQRQGPLRAGLPAWVIHPGARPAAPPPKLPVQARPPPQTSNTSPQ